MTTCEVFILSFLLVIGRILTNSTTAPTQVTVKVEKSNNTNVTIEDVADEGWEFENHTYIDTRRILYSKRVPEGKRPYMVYLQLTKESAKIHKYRGWLCGGVILHPYYVLTSAACVEDADHFYIVSGTTTFVDSFDYKSDDCVSRRRRKVVWKCIPKNYKFDFQDSIKWSSNDIAIVKVDKPFKFGVKEGGCEFATDLVCYNNVSRDLEKAGTKGFIAGWGSGNNFREGVYRRQNVHVPENAKFLQEAKVCVMDNEQCAKKWAQRFRSIITQYMICTKDVMRRLSEICDKKYANCTDVESRRIQKLKDHEKVHDEKTYLRIDVGRHLRDPDDYTARRTIKQGGFCENDHGGPLIVKYQGKERVIGVISACKIDPKTHSCHGPFLYTSVFMNRQFISCAINKDVQENCRRVFRSGITHEEWSVDWGDVDEDNDEQDKASGEKRDKVERAEKVEKVEKAENADDSDEEKKDNLRKKDKEERKDEDSASSSDSKEDLTKASKKNTERTHKEKHSKQNKTKEYTKEKKKSGILRGEVFYESSRDENVNEPDEE